MLVSISSVFKTLLLWHSIHSKSGQIKAACLFDRLKSHWLQQLLQCQGLDSPTPPSFLSRDNPCPDYFHKHLFISCAVDTMILLYIGFVFCKWRHKALFPLVWFAFAVISTAVPNIFCSLSLLFKISSFENPELTYLCFC